jgi:hypothetical protein
MMPLIPPTMGRDVPSGEAEGAYEAIVDHVLRLPTLAATLTHEARIERELVDYVAERIADTVDRVTADAAAAMPRRMAR